MVSTKTILEGNILCLHKVLPVAVVVVLVKVVVSVVVVDVVEVVVVDVVEVVVVAVVVAIVCSEGVSYSVYTNFCLFLILQLFHLSAKWSQFFWSPSREKTGWEEGERKKRTWQCNLMF